VLFAYLSETLRSGKRFAESMGLVVFLGTLGIVLWFMWICLLRPFVATPAQPQVRAGGRQRYKQQQQQPPPAMEASPPLIVRAFQALWWWLIPLRSQNDVRYGGGNARQTAFAPLAQQGQ
jgi:hypothetical protein